MREASGEVGEEAPGQIAEGFASDFWQVLVVMFLRRMERESVKRMERIVTNSLYSVKRATDP